MTATLESPRTRDRELAAAVRTAIHESEHLDGDRVRVLARDGVVRLRGTVRCFASRLLARELAVRVPGVADVLDELEVRPVASGWRRGDAAIARSIRRALARASVPLDDVAVTVEQHVVTLAGVVPDAAARRRIRRLAERVRGVHFVHNELRLRGAAR